MTKIFIVVGDDGGGENSTVFGCYPSKGLANTRLESLNEAYADCEDGCAYMEVIEVVVGVDGGDCSISIG